MTGRRRLLSLVSAVAVAGVAAAAALGAVSWGSPIVVPGSASLNSGGYANVRSISCTGAHTCAAGGYYQDASSARPAYVVNETAGVWGNAVEVPGMAALDSGGWSEVDTVSCASTGNCGAGGFYHDGSGHEQAYVVDESNGTWGNAIEVPGTSTLNHDQGSLNSISCPAAGNCAAGGNYVDANIHTQVWVANEKNGVWGNAKEVPGSGALNTGGSAWLMSISCGSAGNCTAGGYYRVGNDLRAFIVSSKGGVWGKAHQVPGTASLNAGGNARVVSVSCPSAKACVAGGTYADASMNTQSFVVSGHINSMGIWVWAQATVVPGTPAALGVNGQAQLTVLSCTSAASCSAGGIATLPTDLQAFVVNRRNGVWGPAKEVTGIGAFGGYSVVTSLSCASEKNCAAVGTDDDFPGVFVVSENSDGVWGTATQLAGFPAAAHNSDVGAISCAPATTTCGIGGTEWDNTAAGYQAYVTSP